MKQTNCAELKSMRHWCGFRRSPITFLYRKQRPRLISCVSPATLITTKAQTIKNFIFSYQNFSSALSFVLLVIAQLSQRVHRSSHCFSRLRDKWLRLRAFPKSSLSSIKVSFFSAVFLWMCSDSNDEGGERKKNKTCKAAIVLLSRNVLQRLYEGRSKIGWRH